MPPVIDIKGLTKTYSLRPAGAEAHRPDQIGKGEIFALLGPNGAGKTTLISIVCGIVTPSTGHGHRRRPRHPEGLPPGADRRSAWCPRN